MKPSASLKSWWILWVWNHTPTCAEMARLTSLRFEHRLPLPTRLKMQLHWLICVWCERYHKHVGFLHQAAPQLAAQTPDLTSRRLSNEAKQRLAARLKAASTTPSSGVN